MQFSYKGDGLMDHPSAPAHPSAWFVVSKDCALLIVGHHCESLAQWWSIRNDTDAKLMEGFAEFRA
jgi:hypothetical protein